MNKKEHLIKGGYLVGAVSSDGNKVLWVVVDNRVVEEGKDHDGIGLRGVGFNLFDKYEEGIVRELLSEYTYLLILMKLRYGYWKNQL